MQPEETEKKGIKKNGVSEKYGTSLTILMYAQCEKQKKEKGAEKCF